MNKISFGTGGWRAIIGEDFTKDNIQRVAAGISMLAYKQRKLNKPIVVGFDNRFLSEEAAQWVTEMLISHGARVLLIERPVPTPLVMHMVQKQGLHFGIEITASHNPYNYNGIKLCVDEGRDAPLDVTTQLEEIINGPNPKVYTLTLEEGIRFGFVTTVEYPFSDFMSDILKILDTQTIKSNPLKVMLDPMHGPGYVPLRTILEACNCEVHDIHSNRDAFFGKQLPAPTEETLRELQQKVVDGGYDLGIALDGDGDRLGIIDATGKYINANEILCLLYYYLVKHKGWKGPVVRNIATTHMLDKIAASFNEQCYEVPVGFKHVSAKIDEVDAVLGGESSGGLTVRGHIHGKDSIYAASLFVEMVSALKKKPSELMHELSAQFGKFGMVEYNCAFPADKKQIEKLLFIDKQLPQFHVPVSRISYEDGCKVYFANGDFIVCRFSGTEPVLRIFAESSNPNEARKYIQDLQNFLKM